MVMNKKKADKNPKVHDELEGFDIKINSFGEISSTLQVEKLNSFLDKNVVDKKLKSREELDVIRKKENDADSKELE